MQKVDSSGADEFISMKEMVRRSGLSEHTLRYYEKVGLLSRIGRDSSSRHRYYNESDVYRVVTLACLRATGMSIEQMRQYLGATDASPVAAQGQIDLFEDHGARLRRQMARLQRQLEYLDGKVAYWRAIARGNTEQAQAISLKSFDIALEINKEYKEK
ncbi:MerR family transcriptional regulator [Curtobacterium sp. 22159]|uniref:MerR family transcriptional regulator n=1 Tax=Curtobacterium sp. 22159 TaxID=3453882 RepID=UPI003F87DC6A